MPKTSLTTIRLCWLCLAWIGIGLGAMGVLLPLLPTTPFLLAAAWAAPKGSPRLSRWLYQHATFGPLLLAWQQQKAVPIKAKVVACVMMLMSWITLWFCGSADLVLIVSGTLFLGVGGFLLSRPLPNCLGDTP